MSVHNESRFGTFAACQSYYFNQSKNAVGQKLSQTASQYLGFHQ